MTSTVLVVDDHDDLRELFATYLRHAGLQVLEASDGAEALRVVARASVDLLLLDLSLPEVDGWEVARRLGRAGNDRPSILAFSGHALAGSAEAAHEAGCDAFLAKPASLRVVLSEVRRLLALRHERGDDTAEPVESTVVPCHLATHDRPASPAHLS